MLNSKLFYKLYNSIFMNDIVDEIIKLIEKTEKQKISIIDVGAHRGYFSEEIYYKLNENLKKKTFFYLIEPNKSVLSEINFAKFRIKKYSYAFDRTSSSKNIFFLNNFFSASGSSLKGHSFKDKKYFISRLIIGNLINPFKRNKNIFKKTYVQTITLDKFCKKEKIKDISVLKIDTEGTELDVLKGSIKTLPNIDVICSEIQDDKKKIKSKILRINKLLNKNFKLIYKKKIPIGSFFTNIKSYDFIYLNKKFKNKNLTL